MVVVSGALFRERLWGLGEGSIRVLHGYLKGSLKGSYEGTKRSRVLEVCYKG